VVKSRDITRRKEAEDRLREAEKQYRMLVERIPTITYIREIRHTSESVYVSPQVLDIVGYTPEECTSTPDLWLRILHPDDRESVLAEDSRTNETGEPFTMEYRQFAKDGHLVWIRDEATLVRNEEGETSLLAWGADRHNGAQAGRDAARGCGATFPYPGRPDTCRHLH
jgi:PAS domain S-box-containing protein